MSVRYCPCNGACHVGGDNPCSIDCFGHHEEMHTIDVGYVHTLTLPGGPCRTDCPHPSHNGSRSDCEHSWAFPGVRGTLCPPNTPCSHCGLRYADAPLNRRSD